MLALNSTLVRFFLHFWPGRFVGYGSSSLIWNSRFEGWGKVCSFGFGKYRGVSEETLLERGQGSPISFLFFSSLSDPKL